MPNLSVYDATKISEVPIMRVRSRDLSRCCQTC